MAVFFYTLSVTVVKNCSERIFILCTHCCMYRGATTNKSKHHNRCYK
nr:MAG TPA: hypothetical protein [Caudoviricetes sp.]DAX25235.1 MAG TPA: hypothetical protein [Bacteriophage sp.]